MMRKTQIQKRSTQSPNPDPKILVPGTRYSVPKTKSHLTPFQWQVLAATLDIPVGETRTYKWVAHKIGRPQAVRAVGQALRKNPFPLIIPCHRVIKSDGSLGGYAGRYNTKKAGLLRVEKEIAAQTRKITKDSTE